MFVHHLNCASFQTPDVLQKLLPVEVVAGVDVDAEEGLQEVPLPQQQSQDQVVLPSLGGGQVTAVCC